MALQPELHSPLVLENLQLHTFSSIQYSLHHPLSLEFWGHYYHLYESNIMLLQIQQDMHYSLMQLHYIYNRPDYLDRFHSHHSGHLPMLLKVYDDCLIMHWHHMKLMQLYDEDILLNNHCIQQQNNSYLNYYLINNSFDLLTNSYKQICYLPCHITVLKTVYYSCIWHFPILIENYIRLHFFSYYLHMQVMNQHYLFHNNQLTHLHHPMKAKHIY